MEKRERENMNQTYMPLEIKIHINPIQSLSRVQLFVTPWTSGLPVHRQLLEFTQTHVHWVGDVIQSSHPLLSPSPPAFNLSQYQGFFQWVSSSHQVAKVLEFHLQHHHQSKFCWGGVGENQTWIWSRKGTKTEKMLQYIMEMN